MINSGGGALQNVSSVKALKGIGINIPGLTEQQRVVQHISAIDKVLDSSKLAISAAKKLRSGLLSDLLSGKQGIPDSYDQVMGAA
jgi:restriction endonuclease S subunit